MNPDLKTQLQNALDGRVIFVGIGNTDLGDDGFGVRLAEELDRGGTPDVIVAGTTPERWVGRIFEGAARHVVFLDAVDTRGAPGSAVFLGSSDLVAAYPQVSTHKLALGTLAKVIETMCGAKVWLLGVRPETLRGTALSATVRTSLEALKAILADCRAGASSPIPETEEVAR